VSFNVVLIKPSLRKREGWSGLLCLINPKIRNRLGRMSVQLFGK
jgi:hypothetical protein